MTMESRRKLSCTDNLISRKKTTNFLFFSIFTLSLLFISFVLCYQLTIIIFSIGLIVAKDLQQQFVLKCCRYLRSRKNMWKSINHHLYVRDTSEKILMELPHGYFFNAHQGRRCKHLFSSEGIFDHPEDFLLLRRSCKKFLTQILQRSKK